MRIAREESYISSNWFSFGLARVAALIIVVFFLGSGAVAQETDTIPDNEFSISASLVNRGELRAGGFNPDSLDNQRRTQFIMGRYTISLNYKRSWLEVMLTPQFAGVWGHSAGSLTLKEAWVNMRSRHGLFAKIGRQGLEYDDERIIGHDDWVMTAPTHDVAKFGYEGFGHKVHAILAYNQNAANIETGTTYYSGGMQPYKTMQTLWYHYDTPKSLLGFSLIGMNIGMQEPDKEKPKTYYQQLFGTFVALKPKYTNLEGAFYYQTGREEHGIPLSAFMGSVKLTATPIEALKIRVGYDYLSGDKYFNIPHQGQLGMVFHDKIRGFSPVFGSHHAFYGAMDFFYLDSYVGNFTPGLQNLYLGVSAEPVMNMNVSAAYHFFAIAANIENLKKPLGHQVEAEASYTFAKFVKVAAGYTYMRGTKTMEVLQKVDKNRRLHWGWVMISVTPTVFSTSWLDKKKRNNKDIVK
ncbi:MAG: alginate export family protein [Bacteroidales bacterium]|nr:alginate export family protein [Bacteroidales bacterium]